MGGRTMGWRGVILVLLVLLALCSCRTVRTEYVPVYETRTDTMRQTVERTDSVWVYDSIHVRETPDTVWLERWHKSVRERTLRDTVYRVLTDTVPRPYPVEREQTRWERTKQDWGGWAMLALSVICAGFIWCLARKRLL